MSITEHKRHIRGIIRSMMARYYPPTNYPPENLKLLGKVAIVTGSASCLGLEACRQLLSSGVSKLMPTRFEK
jgi:FlaA1/EpsC-like NDP-sugar epimerase